MFILVWSFVDGYFIPLAMLAYEIFDHIADASVVSFCGLFECFLNLRRNPEVEIR